METAIERLTRWRDVGGVSDSYTAGSDEFAQDVCIALGDIRRLRAALEPFARADRAIGDEPGPFRFETGRGHRLIEREDFRRAAEALK